MASNEAFRFPAFMVLLSMFFRLNSYCSSSHRVQPSSMEAFQGL